MKRIWGILAAIFLGGTSLSLAAVPYQAFFQATAGDRWPDRAAQIKAESAFNPKARSYCGAMGLAQFMPGTWKEAQRLGWVTPQDRPEDPEPAIRANHRYMLQIEAQFHGDWGMALGGYNAGPFNIQRALRHVQRTAMIGADAWLRALPAITKDHAAETQGYVARCTRYRAEIRKGAGLVP